MDERAAARPEDVGLCSKRIERVAAWMQSQVADGRLAGIEVMIERRGRTAFHRCHGKADIGRDVQEVITAALQASAFRRVVPLPLA